MNVITDKTIPETIQELVGYSGIFSIAWLKKDTRKFIMHKGRHTTNTDYNKHSIFREGIFRLGVKKNLRGDARNTKESDYLIAYDMRKKGYRNIYYNSILQIRANGKLYLVQVSDSKDYRMMIISENDKKKVVNE